MKIGRGNIMNTVLLIVGVIIIVVFAVLIAVSSNKAPDKMLENHSPKRNIYTDNKEKSDNLFYEKIRDEVLESPIKKGTVVKIEPIYERPARKLDVEEGTKDKKKNTQEIVDIQEPLENTIIIEDIQSSVKQQESEKEKKLSIINEDVENMTDRIIKMNQEGLTVNEIAKRLDKGVREIEITLKVNKINY